MTKLDKKRILDYLEQVERSGEHKYLVELFSELEGHPEFSEFLKNDWNRFFDSENNVNKDLSGVLNRLHKEIEAIEEENKPSFTKRLINTYSRIAAILLLPLIAASVYLYSVQDKRSVTNETVPMAEVVAPANARVKYTLPDSSVVWLNSGSHIKYSTAFAKNRHIELKGKAYFEVTHDSYHPFSVSFPNGKVEVLGTKFSVSTKDNGDFYVTLVEGKVRALVGKDNKPVILIPDQMLAVNGNDFLVKSVNAKNSVAWINGKLIFRDTPFNEVAQKLSDWYNVDVIIKDPSLNRITYRGVFKDENIENVLRLMSMTLPIRYKELPREITKSNGTYKKQKIIIYSNQ